MILPSIKLGFFIASRQIRRSNRWMTYLTVSIMMFTFLNLIATSGFLVGIIAGSEKEFKREWTGDVFLSSLDNERDILSSREVMAAVATLPTVTSYSGRLLRQGEVEIDWVQKKDDTDANRISATLAGIVPSKEDTTTGLSSSLVAGSWLNDHDAKGILIGSALLQEYSVISDLVSLLRGVEVGDMVRISVGETVNEFTVRGIIDSKVDFVSNRIYMLDSELRKLSGAYDLNVSEIAIVGKEKTDPYWIKGPLVANGFSDKARINTAEEGAPAFLVNIKQFFSVIGTLLGSMSVVVALITIFIIIYINALTRRKQIGILKGIGVLPLALEASYVFQALLYVVIGSGIALVIIFAVLKPLIDTHPIDTPFASIVLVAEWKDVLSKWMMVIFVSMIAGYLPARLIIKQNTLNAILGR